MKEILKYSALVVVVALLAACDKVPLLAPANSTITLSANATIIPTGGTVGLTAFVTESSGTPVQNGTTVRFTTTLGTVTPTEAQTTNGIAVATFQAGTASGVAEVHAISGGATGTTRHGHHRHDSEHRQDHDRRRRGQHRLRYRPARRASHPTVALSRSPPRCSTPTAVRWRASPSRLPRIKVF